MEPLTAIGIIWAMCGIAAAFIWIRWWVMNIATGAAFDWWEVLIIALTMLLSGPVGLGVVLSTNNDQDE